MALLVGVSDYNGDGDFDDVDDLKNVNNQVKKWKSFLDGRNFDYEVLLNHNASATNIKNFIHGLKTHEDETSDKVLFMWGGHGRYDETDEESYIMLGDYQDPKKISASQLKDWFSYESWQSEHTLYEFDTCHAGGMDILADHGGSFVAMSSRSDQISYYLEREDSRDGKLYGVFTYYFLLGNETGKGLMGGQCTEDAFEYAQTNTISYVRETFKPDIYPWRTEQYPVKAKNSWTWWLRGYSITP